MRVRVLVGPGDDCSTDDLDGGRIVDVATLRPDKDVRHPDGRGYLGLLLAVPPVRSSYRDAQAAQCKHHDQQDPYKDYYDSVLHLAPPSWSCAARARTVLAQTTDLLSIKALRPLLLPA